LTRGKNLYNILSRFSNAEKAVFVKGFPRYDDSYPLSSDYKSDETTAYFTLRNDVFCFQFIIFEFIHFEF